MSIKALSFTNPWGPLVIHGKKIIDTRSWGTEYEGWLLIHASANYPKEAQEFATDPYVQEALHGKVEFVCGEPIMSRGGYIGMARLVCARLHHGRIERVKTVSQMHHYFRLVADGEAGKKHTGPVGLALTAEEEAFGDYSPGRWAWYLTDPVAFPRKIPAKGRLKLFTPTPEEIEQICSSVPEVAHYFRPLPELTEADMRREELRQFEARLRQSKGYAPIPGLLQGAKS